MARLIILSVLGQYLGYQLVRFLLRGGHGTLAMRNFGGRRRRLRYSRHIEQRRTRHIVGVVGNIGSVVRLDLFYGRVVQTGHDRNGDVVEQHAHDAAMPEMVESGCRVDAGALNGFLEQRVMIGMQ